MDTLRRYQEGAAELEPSYADEFQSLLEMEYQRQQRLPVSHYHECVGCGVTLICVCSDRRQEDRLTGKPRRLLCVACGEIAAGMAAQAGGRTRRAR